MGEIIQNFRKYGWVKDIPDTRDYLYKRLLTDITIPVQVDLRATCPPVEDQGNLGSCTANALAGNLEFLEIKSNALFWDISRLFIYYNERKIEGDVQFDNGAQLRDGIKSLVTYGYCSEKRIPYDITKFTKRPSCVAYMEAKKNKISSYYSLQTMDEMNHCIANGYPFVFGFDVFESFESPEVAHTGIVPIPGLEERMLGGHAVCAVGYDQDKKWFIVRNSWGTDWGDQGYCYMPFDYVIKHANDFWSIRK
jgi:C1A family cysteine protease